MKQLRMSTLTLLAATGLLTGYALADAGHDAKPGRPGDSKQVSRTIVITMTESDGKMSYTPSEITIKRGQTVKIVAKNGGDLEHELVIDTVKANAKHKIQMEKHPDMEHDDPNAVRVKTKTQKEIIWRFTTRGTFEYACLIPGHYGAGMKGRVVVK